MLSSRKECTNKRTVCKSETRIVSAEKRQRAIFYTFECERHSNVMIRSIMIQMLDQSTDSPTRLSMLMGID